MATRAAYVKTVWVDRDATDPNNIKHGTKVNATNLNKLEEALTVVDAAELALEERVGTLETNGLPQAVTDEITALQNSVTTLTNNYNQLLADFQAHVHANEAGDTTGGVIVPTA
jgi:hypothetical protein